MFRHRGSGYARRARRGRAWGTGLVALTGCGAVVLAVHFATAPRAVDAVNSSYSHAFRAYGGQGSHHGYGRGGYTMMPHPSEATAATSQNWAGYVAAGNAGTFTSVSTSWTQPTVTCDAADTFSSFWVGLDGAGTPTVEQTGTEADCANGAAVYGGWYEIFPNAPVFYNEPVQPGDAMSASVVSNGGGSFTLTLSDATQNWTQTTNQSVPSAQLGSAEVIAEAPSSQAVLPLANFGTVNFANATVNGQGIGGANPMALTMASNNGTTEATPSALTGQSSFTVTWDSSGSIATTTTTTTGTGTGTGAGTGTGTGSSGTGRHHHHGNQGQG
jgi:hypothetical protein